MKETQRKSNEPRKGKGSRKVFRSGLPERGGREAQRTVPLYETGKRNPTIMQFATGQEGAITWKDLG